jgi:hypothetical protein
LDNSLIFRVDKGLWIICKMFQVYHQNIHSEYLADHHWVFIGSLKESFESTFSAYHIYLG